VKIVVFVEGGDRGDLRIQMRKAFQGLFAKAGVKAEFRPCGGRKAAYDSFCTARENPFADDEIYFLLADSEDIIDEKVEESGDYWRHLKKRDNWDLPAGALKNHLLLMVTCTESWIMADSEAVNKIFKRDVQISALFSVGGLEQRGHTEVIKALEHATRNCSAKYGKGKHSPALIEALDPQKLAKLSHWRRCVEILSDPQAALAS
jgi:hypothetical protein